MLGGCWRKSGWRVLGAGASQIRNSSRWSRIKASPKDFSVRKEILEGCWRESGWGLLGAGARQMRNSSRWLMSMQTNSAPVSIVLICSPQSKGRPNNFSVRKEMLDGCWRDSRWGALGAGAMQIRKPSRWLLSWQNNSAPVSIVFICSPQCRCRPKTFSVRKEPLEGCWRESGWVVLGAGARQIHNASKWLMSMQNNSAPVSIVFICSPQCRFAQKPFRCEKNRWKDAGGRVGGWFSERERGKFIMLPNG